MDKKNQVYNIEKSCVRATLVLCRQSRQSVAFHTGFSRVFHPCIMVPRFTLPHFSLLRFQSPLLGYEGV